MFGGEEALEGRAADYGCTLNVIASTGVNSLRGGIVQNCRIELVRREMIHA